MERQMHAHARENLELLFRKLNRIQTDYEWARSRGDAERARRCRLQLEAITAERDRIIKNVSDAFAAKSKQSGPHPAASA
jgi:hypothetical protein